jgi:hypothetical protein
MHRATGGFAPITVVVPCILEQPFSVRKKTLPLALGPASEADGHGIQPGAVQYVRHQIREF